MRFRTSYNASAPDDKGRAAVRPHAVNLKGNRWLNHALHILAVTHIAHDSAGTALLRTQADRGQD